MLLEMKNIVKFFGPVKAVDSVSLSIGEGEVHGLLGENGAGKSTLMNILAGVLQCDSGEIFFDGENRKGLTPKKSSEIGIRFIHQELNLFNDLTVFENIFLSEELTNKFGVLDKKTMIQRAKEVFKELHVDIDPTALVGDLETSKKQLVEIGKSILFNSKLIIMDEPTASLNNQEIEGLFKMINSLKAKNVSFIYISHKMPELFEICDKYTVLRDGKFIETGYFKDIDEMKATELLVGKKLNEIEVVKHENKGDVILDVNSLSCDKFFSNINFKLRKGEVIAITGLEGDGRAELADSLFGVKKATSGTISFNGKPIKGKNVYSFMKAGISMVARERKERSIIKDLTIINNLSVAKFILKHKSPIISKKEEIKRYEKHKNKLNIKADSPFNLITSLSGGNQQKVILARWLELDTPVIILDNPTQGIDVGAKFEIYNLINALAEEGKSLIVFSSEFMEINKIADRCLVMYKGNIQAELQREDFDEVKFMYYATGGKN